MAGKRINRRGFAMGGFYMVGGNLLLPVVAHIAANMRVLLNFPPERRR